MKIFLPFLIAFAFLFGNVANGKPFQKNEIVKVLTEEGFRPTIEDDLVIFKFEGDNFIIDPDLSDDNGFIEINNVVSLSTDLSKNLSKTKLELLASKISDKKKILKINNIHKKDGKWVLWFTIECFSNSNELKNNINRYLKIISSGIKDLIEEL